MAHCFRVPTQCTVRRFRGSLSTFTSSNIIQTNQTRPSNRPERLAYRCYSTSHRPERLAYRCYSTSHRPTDFAFAFDIDGVLLRSSKPLPRATTTLEHLNHNSIPYILLTNGGGMHESKRVAELSSKLAVPIKLEAFIQSHTPFAELVPRYADKNILVVGGDGEKCRDVALRYGFKNVLIPADIITAHPSLHPFNTALLPTYRSLSKPLPSPSPQISAIFVFADPRDWAPDIQLILDLMLSSKGILGTYSSLNGDRSLPNNGYGQDSQPDLYFSNADLLWAASYHLSRLGQGGFRAALEGVWDQLTHGAGLERMTLIGKPFHETYAFAEEKLMKIGQGVKRVYMVGDNPESDIRGANNFKSPRGVKWESILVKSGVYKRGKPSWEPKVVVEGVGEAVDWALDKEGWSR